MASEIWFWTLMGACGLSIWFCFGWLMARFLGEFFAIYRDDDDAVIVEQPEERRG